MNTNHLESLVLRIGIAFAFLYPAIDAIFVPDTWIGYFPGFMHGIVSDMVLLHGFGLTEVVIALWILSGWRIFLPSIAATAVLLAIVLFDRTEFDIVFRDLSIAAASLSLALQSCKVSNTIPGSS